MGLGRFSLLGKVEELRSAMVDQHSCLGDIALFSQATAIYAQPNTGKTLVMLHLIAKAIDEGRLDPQKMFYLNVDDNSVGLFEKGSIAQKYGFHMLAHGYGGFKVKDFLGIMEEMIIDKSGRGAVVVLDTLTKFVDTMSKGESREFAEVVRRFTQVGGAVIALAHTNKHASKDGKLVYAGTSDIVNEFDCVYMMSALRDSTNEKVVEFLNTKRRGNNASKVAYAYGSNSTSYEQLFRTVCEVNGDALKKMHHSQDLERDGSIIAAVHKAIAEGVTNKTEIIRLVMDRARSTRRVVEEVLDRYSGKDILIHEWCFTTGQHNKTTYYSLTETKEGEF